MVLLRLAAGCLVSCFVANAYTSESMPQHQQRSNAWTSYHVERPLAAPFPNGPCGGQVVTLPRVDLFPGQEVSSGNNPFFNLNQLNPFTSLVENVVLPPRDVKVWLPKEYHSSEYRHQRFPVLYCHDGQNAFDDSSSWTGSSMRLAGALTRLSERNMLRTATPPIVVCIPCAEGTFLPGMPRRHGEYGDYNHPVSQAHGVFVATTLHPYITNRFRVKDGSEHISTIGCSLGGQASLQLVLRYPEIFGGAACLSPCFQPGTIAAVTANLVTTNDFAASIGEIMNVLPKPIEGLTSGLKKDHDEIVTADLRSNLRSKNIYIDNGGDADDKKVPIFDVHDHFTMNDKFWNPGYWWLDTNLQPMIDAMRFIFDQAGVKYTYEKFPGGRHNERAWAGRIHHPLLALYGKRKSD